MIKYRLTDFRKNKNIIIGDGLADIFKMMLPYAVSQIPYLPPALQHLNPTQDPQWARFHQHSC